MNYIADEKGYVGDFGSEATVVYFRTMAETRKLPFLLSFLTLGATIHLKEVIKDIRSVEWPGGFQGLQDVADSVVNTLGSCKGIAFLTDGTDILGENPEIV